MLARRRPWRRPGATSIQPGDRPAGTRRPLNISAEAGIQAIRDGHTRYTPPAGLPRLREVIAEYASRQHGMEIRPSTGGSRRPGTKPRSSSPPWHWCGQGMRVIYPDPGFPTYRDMIGVAGGVPVPVPLREETDSRSTWMFSTLSSAATHG